MSLIARNLSGGEVTLSVGNPHKILPVDGSPVNVTAELRGLSAEDYATLQAQMVTDHVTLTWTGTPEYDLGTAPTNAPATGNAVVWAPFLDPGPGYFTEWADVVKAVNQLTGPTTIKIQADPWDDDPVVIPGGLWTLNDTTIEGCTTYAHGGRDWEATPPQDSGSPWSGSTDVNRGNQILLAVYTEGHFDEDVAYDHPCRLRGVRGLKDMFFRGDMWASDPEGSGNLTFNAGVVTVTRTNGNLFSPIDSPDVSVGMPSAITISGAVNNDNNGTFDVISWIDENTVTFANASGVTETGISWAINRNNSTFFYNETFGRYGEFRLDNVDFRRGGAQYGSFYVGEDGRLFVKLLHAASMRMGSFGVEGRMVVQGDGSPCRVGNTAVSGGGHAKFYLTPGMEFSNFQCISYDVFQSTTWYTAADNTKWSGPPTTVNTALDQLAARVYALENP